MCIYFMSKGLSSYMIVSNQDPILLLQKWLFTRAYKEFLLGSFEKSHELLELEMTFTSENTDLTISHMHAQKISASS